MAEGRKRKLSRQEIKSLLPSLKNFNKMARILIESLMKKIEREEKKVKKIAVMVNGMKLPQKQDHLSSINIQTLDMNRTTVKKKGNMSYNQVMDWERNIRRKNKGIIL